MPLIKLRILATTDLHLGLCARNGAVDRGHHLLGLSRQIEMLRQEMPNTLLVDNGDFLQGGQIDHSLVQLLRKNPRRQHPMILAMNLLRYDAAALGNHEFDHGLPYLRRALRRARFPTLCANLDLPHEQAVPSIAPWVILERSLTDTEGKPQVVRIGVFGVLPPQLAIWAQDHLPRGTKVHPILHSAQKACDDLRQAGADVVLALSHSGLTSFGTENTGENVSDELARCCDVDAVIAGHDHQIFPRHDPIGQAGFDPVLGHVHGVALCQPGVGGSHIGVIDLTLDQTKARGWKLVASRARIDRANGPEAGPPAGRFQKRCNALSALLTPYLTATIGESAVPVSSLFALVEDCAPARLVALALRDHVKGALVGTLFEKLPVLGVASAMRCGGHDGPDNYIDLPAGPLREADIEALSPFPNRVHALLTNGAGLRNWLEHAAGVFAKIVPGQADQTLLRQDMPPYGFDVIEGVTYQIDLTAPPRFSPRGVQIAPDARRIVDLRHDGRLVGDDDGFVLAVNSFRSAGGGQFPGSGSQAVQILANPPDLNSILRNWLRDHSPVAPPTLPIWRFVRLARTSALFETSPRALDKLPKPGLTHVGFTPEGFALLRLDLMPLASSQKAQYSTA